MSAQPIQPDVALARRYLDLHPEEASAVLEAAPVEDVAAMLQDEPGERMAASLRRLTPDRGCRVLARLDDASQRRLFRLLDPAVAAALLGRLDAEPRERCLAAAEPGVAAEIRDLMEYPPDTAGSLMDPRVTTFRPDAAVRDVVQRLRTFRQRRIQDVFLVGEEEKLLGVVPLQAVVLAPESERIENLMRPAPSVQATASREEVVETLQAHRVASLPVTDFEGRLLGVLRQEQLIAVAEQDATADLVKMVGASQDERALSTPFFSVRRRLPWLQINLLTAFLAASVVGLFESTIARFTALAVLLPVVAGQSGNTGAQALAVTMRGLALREVRVRHWFRVSGKELAVGAVNGVAVAVTTAAAVYVWSRSVGLMLVIGISMVMSMTLASLAGAAIPMALTALRQDPAQSSSIILTTVTDVVGFFSFLGIATLLAAML
jgi:magnesium transporter